MSEHSESDPIGRILGQVCRLHHHRAHTLFEEIGLYRGQPPLLFKLWEKEGRTHSDLAALIHVRPATVTRMIQRMERAGYVECRDDPHDQRVSRVFLTHAGREIEGAVEKIWHTLEAEIFEGFSPDEQDLLRRFLLRVRNNLVQATGERLPS